MEIVNSLKSRIGSAEEAKISQFLGESSEAVDKSLDLSLNAMLGGLIEIRNREGNAESILKVINDGGHSGDIIDDLSGLFDNRDKMNLLITIGKNISNHFYKSHSQEIIEKISALGGISQESALSIFSLSAPLVLGAMGKSIRLENLSATEFSDQLGKEQLPINEAVKSSLLKSLGFVSSPQLEPEAPEQESSYFDNVEEESIEEEVTIDESQYEESDNGLNWFAWVLLAVLGISVLYYGFKDKFIDRLSNSDNIVLADSSAFNSEEDIFDALNTERNKNDIAPEELSKPTSANSPIRTTTVSPSSSSTGLVVSSDSNPMTNKLNSSDVYFGINRLSYIRNSAEVRSRGAIIQLVDYLQKNQSAQIDVVGTGTSSRLAEDRAYAIQGLLFENGIDVSRVNVISSPVRGADPVMVKIR